MTQSDFDKEVYLEIERNLNALGIQFFSVANFFWFLEEYIKVKIYADYFTVHLNYIDEENQGYFVCRIDYPSPTLKR